MTLDEKLRVVEYLIFLQGKIQGFSFELELQGKEVSKIDAAEKDLSNEIKRLRRNAHQQWSATADEIIGDFRNINDKIQRRINAVRSIEEGSEKIVEIVGLVDDVVAVVKQFV